VVFLATKLDIAVPEERPAAMARAGVPCGATPGLRALSGE
jgi:hypothetical protein